MSSLKHVGRISTNHRKCIVAYRVVPNEPENCIVVTTESLDAGEHDALMKLVESDAGQFAYELGEAMARTTLPDGRNMLAGFHKTGRLNKISSDKIEMTPNSKTAILLSDINNAMAEQQGVTVDMLALGPKGRPLYEDPASATQVPKEEVFTAEEIAETATTSVAETGGVLTDEQLAAQYRSQADALFKEAKALREQAEELVPTKKRTAKAKTESSV